MLTIYNVEISGKKTKKFNFIFMGKIYLEICKKSGPFLHNFMIYFPKLPTK